MGRVGQGQSCQGLSAVSEHVGAPPAQLCAGLQGKGQAEDRPESCTPETRATALSQPAAEGKGLQKQLSSKP